ncbi:MAG: hypothetical protein A2157_04595 [Deltaproteobacteria bacterium RBG_16_47_11]|nr:MAG: hypothetical protein A2157_04595 [Deltaproteobacteria bacterium RBG_16_47_11]
MSNYIKGKSHESSDISFDLLREGPSPFRCALSFPLIHRIYLCPVHVKVFKEQGTRNEGTWAGFD